ncbi:Hypothetical protein CINCED_3A012711 [Cinara cedri]|uniref:Uncharacterized protein n=1 Tax=Cinara cedri TaxID=506608 RepID=A0A5E4NNQ5_9HEMI|nr:Hypothetical protein CINCED_3A012711 [Cinara cedri]
MATATGIGFLRKRCNRWVGLGPSGPPLRDPCPLPAYLYAISIGRAGGAAVGDTADIFAQKTATNCRFRRIENSTAVKVSYKCATSYVNLTASYHGEQTKIQFSELNGELRIQS